MTTVWPRCAITVHSVVVGQVPAGGVGAGIQTCFDELLAQPQDEVNNLWRGGVRRASGTPGAWLERSLALGSIPGQELADPALRHAMVCATSAWVRPSMTTAVMTSLAFDTTEHRAHDPTSYVLRHGFPMS